MKKKITKQGRIHGQSVAAAGGHTDRQTDPGTHPLIESLRQRLKTG